MSNIRDALLRMVSVVRISKELDEKLYELGYAETPYRQIYSDTVDAIYHLVGENTESFDESITKTILDVPIMLDERRADMLESIYRKNNVQPHPATFEREEMENLHRENGGYLRETPEGDWS